MDPPGRGTTSTAAEFARWYSLTRGQVLFTSFEPTKPLRRVLDNLAELFPVELKALDDAERLGKAPEVLRQNPVLWIRDRVENVAGSPQMAPSDWSVEEQKELADFLRCARYTKARYLLTSSREEKDWPADLSKLIKLPPMPELERKHLIVALLDKCGRRFSVDEWGPLLRCPECGPNTIIELVDKLVVKDLTTKIEIGEFLVRELVQLDQKDNTEKGSVVVA